MNVYKNFDKCLDIISSFNGVGLNIDEKLKLEIALRELHSEKKIRRAFFLGENHRRRKRLLYLLRHKFRRSLWFPR